MQVIEAQRASILVPHDHLHISHVSPFDWAYQRLLCWPCHSVGGVVHAAPELPRYAGA